MAICGILKLCKRSLGNEIGEGGGSMEEGGHQGVNSIDVHQVCDFSGSSDLCVCIITWNMNGRVSYEDVERLVGKRRKLDLMVIGLQEAPRNKILKYLQTALSTTHVMLGKAVMQSVQLYVFGPLYSEFYVKELKVDKHPVGGCGSLIGRNKGAVAIRINYKGINMLFIACHLSAHAKNVEERNEQFRRISKSLYLSKKLNLQPSQGKLAPQIVVWLGDLNYRLQGVDSYPVRDLIHTNLQNLLTGKDQLLQEAERGVIFEGFNEGTLKFKPTYKYDVGTTNYDTSHKVRVPAWTDRILFKNQDPDHIKPTLHCYDSMDNIRSSDHKPVTAHLCFHSLTPPHS